MLFPPAKRITRALATAATRLSPPSLLLLLLLLLPAVAFAALLFAARFSPPNLHPRPAPARTHAGLGAGVAPAPAAERKAQSVHFGAEARRVAGRAVGGGGAAAAAVVAAGAGGGGVAGGGKGGEGGGDALVGAREDAVVGEKAGRGGVTVVVAAAAAAANSVAAAAAAAKSVATATTAVPVATATTARDVAGRGVAGGGKGGEGGGKGLAGAEVDAVVGEKAGGGGMTVTVAKAAVAATAAPVATAFVERVYKGIFYLKTHKSGSSAVREALRAYSVRHDLRFKLHVPGDVFINSPAPVANRSANRVDAFFTHHATFDNEMLATYLGSPPSFVLTSLRLPLQRQLSWFRQQNREWEELLGPEGGPSCNLGAVAQMLFVFDTWIVENRSASQWQTMQERGARLASARIRNNVTAIAEQFDFIFLKERLAESMECLCVQTGMRLCGKETPLRSLNAKPPDSCVEAALIRYRSDKLMLDSTRDLIFYEKVNNHITACQRNGIPEECWCAEEW